MTAPQLCPPEIEYPESDGRPLGETDIHVRLSLELLDSVDCYFQADPDLYVASNNLLYFEEGNPKMFVVPDFYVVRGVPKGLRRVYKVWEEGKGPSLVIELSSRSTYLEDLGRKRAIYESLSVREYFLFDPEGDKLDPPLQGFRLRRGRLEAMAEPRALGDGTLVLPSEVLGLELRASGIWLRLWDPKPGRLVPVSKDYARAAAEQEERAKSEEQRAEAEKERAEAEKRRADAQERRAEDQKRRADASEAELARLRAELDRLRGP